MYAAGRADAWDSQAARTDFKLIKQRIHGDSLDVLDVGCYSGELLSLLPAPCRLYGVEPNETAASKARARGVQIVASHWGDLDVTRQYDVVITCDVIEHVDDPLRFLLILAAALKPRGRLIITTGNADAWLWKKMRSNFWYCQYPEHISFIGPKWLAMMAPRCGLGIARVTRFRHTASPVIPQILAAFVRNCIYAVSPKMYRKLRAWALAADEHIDARPSLGSHLTKDHFLCELRKL
ncbi:hypothetical protein DBA29_21970 [Xenophilus aerolatus]|nr:hypothetical protein [Xenophilus aerolatus]